MNILIYNRKGGVGKTLVADELLFSLERSGTPHAFIDLDDQGSSIHADTTADSEAADVVIVDTPGAFSKEVQTWMEDADVIVIPVSASGRDIVQMAAALEAARLYAPDTPRVIVANKFNKFKAAQEFMQALAELQQEGETLVTLPAAEAFQNGYLEDRSVVDLAPKSAAAYRTVMMVNAVRDAAGLPPDPVDPQPIKEAIERQQSLARQRRELMRDKLKGR